MPISEVEHIQKNDVKTIIYMEVKDENGDAVSLVSATVHDMYFLQPISQEVDTHGASVLDGPNGVLGYALALGDADEAGLVEAQAYIETPDWEGWTSIKTFFVEANLIERFKGSQMVYVEGV